MAPSDVDSRTRVACDIHGRAAQELLRHVQQAGVRPQAAERGGKPGGLVQEHGRARKLLLEAVHPGVFQK